MTSRYFTLEEAESMIPLLESLLSKAMAGKKGLEDVQSRIATINEYVTLRGGVMLDLEKSAELKAQREAAVHEVKEAIAGIQETGCTVKDLDMGLVDFACRMDGADILLCWKAGETSIEFWHNTNEGYAERKPIKQEWRRGGGASN